VSCSARKSILRWLRRLGALGEREPAPEQDDAPDSLRSGPQLALKHGVGFPPKSGRRKLCCSAAES